MRILLRISIVLFFLFVWQGVSAQEDKIEIAEAENAVEVPDSSVQTVLHTADSLSLISSKMKYEAFKPNPTKSVIFAAVCPGLGQIYNRKYWKLPIVYGAFMGCLYAVTWNNKNYKDYSVAYRDIVLDDPEADPSTWHQSWQNLLPSGVDPASRINDTNFHNTLKRRKDYFRRYRDMSIIITVGVYALSIIDAYVDAQLFDFDVTPDLSMRIEPIMTPATDYSSRTYGVNCSIKF